MTPEPVWGSRTFRACPAPSAVLDREPAAALLTIPAVEAPNGSTAPSAGVTDDASGGAGRRHLARTVVSCGMVTLVGCFVLPGLACAASLGRRGAI